MALVASSIRVGLVDDHPSILAAIADGVRGRPELTLVGTATNLDDALRLADEVDVLVCDIQLAGRAEGLEVLAAVHEPRRIHGSGPPAVLMLSGFDQPSLVRAAIDGGAAGYLSKSAEIPEIIDAIRRVARGDTVYSAAALRSSIAARRRPSAREIEVIGHVATGSTNAEVAAALGLSEKTIESHLRRLFDRYGLMSRTELVVLAIDEGWVRADQVAR